MSQHTKGPWTVDGPFGNTGGGRSLVIEADLGWRSLVVASVNYNDGDNAEECEADARLIAAAPEMLEALRSVLREANARINEYRHDDEWQAQVDRAEALIAKATGGAR